MLPLSLSIIVIHLWLILVAICRITRMWVLSSCRATVCSMWLHYVTWACHVGMSHGNVTWACHVMFAVHCCHGCVNVLAYLCVHAVVVASPPYHNQQQQQYQYQYQQQSPVSPKTPYDNKGMHAAAVLSSSSSSSPALVVIVLSSKIGRDLCTVSKTSYIRPQKKVPSVLVHVHVTWAISVVVGFIKDVLVPFTDAVFLAVRE